MGWTHFVKFWLLATAHACPWKNFKGSAPATPATRAPLPVAFKNCRLVIFIFYPPPFNQFRLVKELHDSANTEVASFDINKFLLSSSSVIQEGSCFWMIDHQSATSGIAGGL
jgi:hypothetical protein